MRYAWRRAHSDEETYGAVSFAEDLRPVIWWQRIFCSVSFWLFPDVPGAFWTDQGGARLSEPLMLLQLARRQVKLKVDEGSTSSDVLKERIRGHHCRFTRGIQASEHGCSVTIPKTCLTIASRFDFGPRRGNFGGEYLLIDDEIHHQFHPSLFQFEDHIINILDGSIYRVNSLVVCYIISHVLRKASSQYLFLGMMKTQPSTPRIVMQLEW